MKFAIKDLVLFIAKLEQISQFISHTGIFFFKGKVLLAGMNAENTLLVSLELSEEALVGYELVKTDDYAFNTSAFLNAAKDATSLKLEFKAGTLIIITNNGKAAISTIKLEHSEEQNKLDFDASFDISPYLPLFKECRLKAKAIFPLQLEGDVSGGMRLKVVVAPNSEQKI